MHQTKSGQERDFYGHHTTQHRHICRMPDDRLIKRVLLGSVDGIRQRGRPRKTWTDNITEWTELLLCEAVWLSQDRASWTKTLFGPNGC